MSMKFFSENMFLIAVAFVSGAMLIWPLVRRGAAGATIDTLRATFLINREDAMVLDVRETNDYVNGHILNARNVPLAQLDDRAADVAKNKAKPVIVYCANGQRAGGAVAILKKHGFANVVNLSGGFTAWKAAGLPVEK
jgi:rhodanese-related sulfurtransferase